MGGGSSQNQQPQPQPQSAPQPQPGAEQVGVKEDQKEGQKKGSKNTFNNKQQKSLSKSNPSKDQYWKEDCTSKGKILRNFTPPCINRNKSTYVCLGKTCKSYPFYCLDCQFECSEAHEHGKKCSRVSVKEFQKRIENRLTLNPILEEAIESYRRSLNQMKESFHQFYLHQNSEMQKVKQQKKLPPSNARLKNKIENSYQQGLNGKQMRQLWVESADWKSQEQSLIKLVKNRKQFLINLHECFNNINSIVKQQQETSQKQPKESLPKTQPNEEPQQQKAYHFYKRYQFDPHGLILSKQSAWSSSRK